MLRRNLSLGAIRVRVSLLDPLAPALFLLAFMRSPVEEFKRNMRRLGLGGDTKTNDHAGQSRATRQVAAKTLEKAVKEAATSTETNQNLSKEGPHSTVEKATNLGKRIAKRLGKPRKQDSERDIQKVPKTRPFSMEKDEDANVPQRVVKAMPKRPFQRENSGADTEVREAAKEETPSRECSHEDTG